MAIERQAAEPSEDGGPTTEIPDSLLAGQDVSPGDVVRLEVVKKNDDGTITVKYAQPEEAEEVGGIDQMASQFNQG